MIYIGTYKEETEKIYFKFISSKINGVPNEKNFSAKIVKLINLYLSRKNKINDFEELILLKYDKLSEIKQELDRSSEYQTYIRYVSDLKDINKKKDKNEKERLLNELNIKYDKKTSLTHKIFSNYKKQYSKFTHENTDINGEKNNIYLNREKNIQVCPYCNRNFINSRKKESGVQFDHFFSKDLYPVFALSLYNLIPSCSVCNHKKSDKELRLSPFNKDLENKTFFGFSFNPVNYEIKMAGSSEADFKESSLNDLELLELKDAYSIHKLDVKFMIERDREYVHEYRESLRSIVGSKYWYKLSEHQFDKMIFGESVEIDHEQYRNIPNSYLKNAIYAQIKKSRKRSLRSP